MRKKLCMNEKRPFPLRKSFNGTALMLAAALVAAALIIIVAGCEKKPETAPPPPIVEVAEAISAGVPMSIEFIGQLDSPQNVDVRARVEAFVDKILFTEGADVKAGDRLFELDSKPYQERLAAAEGALAEAKAALGKYEKDVARLTPLAQKRAIPQQDLDNAIASVEVGKANVLTAQARVESAKIDMGYCDIRSPISGLIGAKQVSVGDLVGKGDPTLMATISVLNPIWFYCNISEVQYLRAESADSRTGFNIMDLPVSLILGDGSLHPDKGKFVFIDRAVDPKTGTLRMRAEFQNADKMLRPGMFARIKVDLGVRPDSILVPERAVSELQGKNFMWVITADNKATQRGVKVSEAAEGKLLILDGLKAGERFVVEGLQKVREGATVQPKTAEQLAKEAAQPGEASKKEKE
jgi:membrane fusion protein, multidrug efflux system